MSLADRLSVQLYSLRAYGSLALMLDIANGAGLSRVEIGEGYLMDPAATRALLDARGLAAPTAHVSPRALRKRLDEVVAAARVVGVTQLSVSGDQRSQNSRDWAAAGRELAGLAPRLADHGIGLAYHNHDWDVRPLRDGGSPLAVLLDAAPEVGWQADLGWLARAGSEIDAWLDRYGDRVSSVHVKDLAAAGRNLDEDGWAAVGAGTLDWRHLLGRCLETPARWFIIEHDLPADGRAFVEQSIAYLRALDLRD
jgi:sugar phosphate isomerase/epimerase